MIGTWVGLGGVLPVDPLIEEGFAVTDWSLDPEVPVAATGFQHQHAVATRRAQVVGEDAARRAGANDDIVEFEIHATARKMKPDYRLCIRWVKHKLVFRQARA